MEARAIPTTKHKSSWHSMLFVSLCAIIPTTLFLLANVAVLAENDTIQNFNREAILM